MVLPPRVNPDLDGAANFGGDTLAIDQLGDHEFQVMVMESEGAILACTLTEDNSERVQP